MATTKKTSTKTIKKATKKTVAAEQEGNYGYDEIAKAGGENVTISLKKVA